MRIFVLHVIFAAVAEVHTAEPAGDAQESILRLADNRVGDLFKRAFKASSLRDPDLDGAILGKPGRSTTRRGAATAAAPPARGAPVANAALVRNGEVSAPWLTKERLLKDHPGAYTTARTVDQKAVFELSMHCTRLHDTALAILRRETSATEAAKKAQQSLEVGGPEWLKPVVKAEISTALGFLDASAGNDYQVTILLTWDTVGAHTPADRGFDLFTFVQPLPLVKPMVEVEAHRAERNNPTIKDVQWVSDRQGLEELQKKAGVNEVVMFDSAGNVTEGLQTNFFAVASDGALLTAPDERVLAGTVRKVVLEVARRHSIPVRLECPNIHDLSTWESCFICSTSRLALPISELAAPEFAARKGFPVEGSTAHRIASLVQEAVRSNAEPISV